MRWNEHKACSFLQKRMSGTSSRQLLMMLIFTSSFIFPRNPPWEFLRGVWVDCHSCVAINPGWFDTSTIPTHWPNRHKHKPPHSLTSSLSHFPWHTQTQPRMPQCWGKRRQQSNTLVRTCVYTRQLSQTHIHTLVLRNVSDLWGMTPLPYFLLQFLPAHLVSLDSLSCTYIIHTF